MSPFEFPYFPTEIPLSSFMPIGLPVRFRNRTTNELEWFEVIEGGIEVSTDSNIHPTTQFRACEVTSGLELYGFTAPSRNQGPMGFNAIACLTGTYPLDQVFGPNTIVLPRRDIIETLLHITKLREQLASMGVADELLRQRLWPFTPEDATIFEGRGGSADIILKMMKDSTSTDGEYIKMPNEDDKSFRVVLQNHSFVYVTQPTPLFIVTADVTLETLFTAIRQHPVI